MKLCCFLVEFSQHSLASTLGRLPDHSHRCRLHAVCVRLSSAKLDSHNPAKEKHGIRESFAKVIFIREEWPFADGRI